MPIFASSRYQFSVGARNEDDDILYLSTPDPFPYQNLPDNIPHIVKVGDTIFALAAKYYAEEPRGAGYYWAIGDFQPEPICHDPTLQLPEGSVVIVPSLLTLRSRILNARRRRST